MYNLPLKTRLPLLALTVTGLAALSGCCSPGGTPVPVGGSVRSEMVVRTDRSIPDKDAVDVPTSPEPDPNSSGPHQTNIVITTKKAIGARAIKKDDVTATLSDDKRTLTLTIKTPAAFEPK